VSIPFLILVTNHQISTSRSYVHIPLVYWHVFSTEFVSVYIAGSRSQWPRGLRHELSSPARTLRSWARIPLEAWMSVYFYSVCAVLYAGSGLATG
jgi:hypothetical protein